MASGYEFIVAGYPLFWTKRWVDPVLFTFYRDSDKRIYKRMFSERNRLTCGEVEEGEDEEEEAVEYRSTAAHVIERLNVMGFTLERARDDFYASLEEHRHIIRGMVPDDAGDEARDEFAARFDPLTTLSFEDWSAAMHEILGRKLPSRKAEDYSGSAHYPIVSRLLRNGMDSLTDGFNDADFRSTLRAMLEVVDPHAAVVLEITDVVDAGYHDRDANLCEEALADYASEYTVNAKIIVLTEGSSDIAVLKESLRLLYPHLYGYYSFMDFSTPNMPGSANTLVTVIKAFIGSGIPNRIVAIFDNDTAAADALRSLPLTPLPDNIAIFTLPVLDFAKNYPTLGPYGTAPINADINGLAVSIELFFGQQVLMDDTGTLTPIQWKGYSEGSKHYQGEIQNKNGLQDKFRAVVKEAFQDPAKQGAHDWSALHLLWQEIFSAFR